MWSLLSLNKIWFVLLFTWLICGVVATLAGFTGLFYTPLALLLLLPITLMLLSIVFLIKKPQHKTITFSGKIIIFVITLWWLVHSLQVFVPETGFDAVWYHLPLAQQTVINHRFIGSTDFYQSFNPQFSDSIFYLGFAVGRELGAKVVAYLLGLTLIFTTYTVSRLLLNRTLSLCVVLLVSSFQVVSWQSSSFYIDSTKALWELSALILILKWQNMNISAGIAFGASLASKLFSVLLLPVMLVITWINNGKKSAVLFLLFSLLVVTPFYLFAYSVSGNAFYSMFHHVNKLSEIGSAESIFEYIVQKILTLPEAFYQIIVTREYSTPLVILLFPLLIICRKIIFSDKKVLSLIIFSLYQFLVWWFIPPTSIRYALSGFVTATILVVYFLNILTKTKQQKRTLFVGLVIAGILALPIRLVVANRSLRYISGQQTKEEYLQQFYDGNIDMHLKKWHKLN